MNYSKLDCWKRFRRCYNEFSTLGRSVDSSRMNLDDGSFVAMASRIHQASSSTSELEKSVIANPDKKRMAGHYWLRNSSLVPTPEIRRGSEATLSNIKLFPARVFDGKIRGDDIPFKNYLLIGIGGSLLGLQFVANALSNPRTDKPKLFFFDNTDPDGMHRVLAFTGADFNRTLCVIISKSGHTTATPNATLVAKAASEKVDLHFVLHAVTITTQDSQLDKHAITNKWLLMFPIGDWLFGITCELFAVGLIPQHLKDQTRITYAQFLKHMMHSTGYITLN